MTTPKPKGEQMIVNLTPHPITLLGMEGFKGTVQPSGTVAQVATTETEVEIDGAMVPVVFAEVVDLPAFDGKTRYIVSPAVKAACPDRDDLLVPWHFVRDTAGAVIAVTPAET